MAEDTWLIANPAARGGALAAELDAIASKVRAVVGAVHVAKTEAPGDATTLAVDAVAAGATRVLSLGGDGTHNEVVEGLMRAQPHGASLGILPAGTGGDLRRSLRHGSIDALVAALPTLVPRRIDVGRATWGDGVSRCFVNLASCGVSGLVDRRVNASSKRLGAASFALATVRAIVAFRAPRVRVTIDGDELEPRTIDLVAACNGRYAGGGMCFAPSAELDDGLLDVVVIDHAPALRSLVDLPKLYRGRLAGVGRVTLRRAKVVTVEPLEGTAPLDLDGESPGDAPVQFRVEPGALALLD
ncbi:diacylglycerol kinase family lipid kinase [Myxococcota bacterium]|nr:diacylglycerol kinase family lipid kinase [Myxococcota bacterium]